MNHRLVVRLTALALACLLGACSSKPPVEVFLINVEPVASTALEQRLALTLRLQNPTERALAASGVRLALDVNGGRFARGVSNVPLQLPPLGETEARIEVSISVFDAVRRMLSVAEDQAVTYRLRGTVFTDGFGRFSFDRGGALEGGPLAALRSLPAAPSQPKS